MAEGVGTRPRYLIVCLLAAPIGLSPLLIRTLCGSERVLVVSTEPPDDLSCSTTLGVGRPGDGASADRHLGNPKEPPGPRVGDGRARCRLRLPHRPLHFSGALVCRRRPIFPRALRRAVSPRDGGALLRRERLSAPAQPPKTGPQPPSERCTATETGSPDAGGSGAARGQPSTTDSLDGRGPQRRPQKRLYRRLPKRLGAVTVGYKCR